MRKAIFFVLAVGLLLAQAPPVARIRPVQAPSHSATPTFDLSQGNVIKPGALTANVTSITVNNAVSGVRYTFIWCQDATGGRTVTYPGSFVNAVQPSPTASTCTEQTFTYDGTNFIGGSATSADTPTAIMGPTRSALGTPASGYLNCWFDSTNTTLECKNSSGAIYTLIVGTTATSNQFLTHIGADGIQVKAQPSFSNLSGTATVAQGGAGASMASTGGTGHVVKQGSVGGNFSTGQVATADVANDAITRDKVSAILRTRTMSFPVGDPAGSALADTADWPRMWRNRLGSGITITEVHCESDAGTPSINLQRDDGTAANILASNLSCSTSGASTTSFSGSEASIANDHKIDFVMVTAGGTAKFVLVTIKFTVD